MVRSKYGAKKVIVDGIKFDSKAESEYYKMLCIKKSKGEIKDFTMQPTFILQKPFTKHNKKYQAIKYKSDFEVIANDGTITIVDVKGLATETAKLKKKLFDFIYPDKTLLWVCKNIKFGDEYGWIEYDELIKKRKVNKKQTVV